MYWDPPFPITTRVVEFNDFAFAFSNVQECLTSHQQMDENLRQEQTLFSLRLNEENEMKLKCFAEKQEAFVLCKNAEMQ